MKTLLSTAALVFAVVAAHAAPFATVDAKIGKVLTDEAGMTLYIFDKDAANTSNCSGSCAKSWPPYAAAAGDKAEGQFGIIARADGSRQWTINGQPLYYWVKDKKVGDTTGDGVGGVWHVVRP